MFTYIGDLSTPLDETRFLIGDTDSTAPLFMDGEINGNLSIYGTPIDAAIALATAQAAKYARKATMSVDGFSVDYTDLAKAMTALAYQLRRQKSERPGANGAPFVGGVSISDMIGNDENTDRVPSQFRIGEDDDPPKPAL